MPWTYSQSTGELRHNGVVVARGYSGNGTGRNNPDAEAQHDVGPIPRGRYQIGASYHNAHTGDVTMNLDPVGHDAHGRTLFRIHGDSRQHPGQASDGCTIFGLDVRQRIAHSGDNVLDVTR